MKKNYLVILVLFSVLQSLAQNKHDNTSDSNIRTYVIEYDFQTGIFPNGKIIRPRVNVPIVFKIKNINRLAYSVHITAKDSSIAVSDIPKQFEIFSKKEVEATKQAISETKTSSLPVTDVVKPSDFLEKATDIDVAKTNKILTERSAIQDTNKLNIPKSSISLKDEKDLGLSEYIQAQTILTGAYLNVNNQFRKLSTLLDDYLYVTVTVNDPLLTSALYKSKYQVNCDNIRNKIALNASIYDDFIATLKDFNVAYRNLKSNSSLNKTYNDGGIQKITSLANFQEEEVTKIKEIIEKLDFKKIRSDLEQFTRFLENPELFEYTSSPIQATQDVAIFKVNIEKKHKESSLFYDERKFDYSAYTKHGIRLDASLGISGSFFPKTSVYALNVNSNDDKQISELQKNQFNPSFVGFFTASYRSATHYTGGFSLGIGFNVEDGRLILDNFFVGPSLIIGKSERITITSGGTFKNLPRLNDTFNVGDIVKAGYTIDNITTKSYKIGYFIGVSYNITKGVKDQLKFLK